MANPPRFDTEEYERFKIWRDLVNQEQTWFWQRFAGFAALHAGVLALTFSVPERPFSKLFFVSLGLLFAAIWWKIQSTSLWYVDRYKPGWHEIRERLDFKFAPQNLHGNRDRSTTDVAMWVPRAVSITWIGVFFLYVVPAIHG